MEVNNDLLFCVAQDRISSESFVVLPKDDVEQNEQRLPCWGFANVHGKEVTGIVLLSGTRKVMFEVIEKSTVALISRAESFIQARGKPSDVKRPAKRI
jgi:hypothetical protein